MPCGSTGAAPDRFPRAGTGTLRALNNAFQMDQQNGLYFTIWYGVYQKATRRIDYSGGGHPPALLLSGPSSDEAVLEILESSGPMVGAVPDPNSGPPAQAARCIL